MGIKTSGTKFYYIDPSDNSVQRVPCLTSISGLSSPLAQIDVTCLEDTARSYEAGLAEPSTLTFGIQFDPGNVSYSRLYAAYKARENLMFAVAYNDGVIVDPVVDTAGEFVLSTANSWVVFDGYISDFPQEFQINDVVRSEVSVQISGEINVIAKA